MRDKLEQLLVKINSRMDTLDEKISQTMANTPIDQTRYLSFTAANAELYRVKISIENILEEEE